MKKNRGSPKEHEQKFKTLMRNQTVNTNKKTLITSKNAKTKEKREDILERKGQSNAVKTNDTTRRDESEGPGERRKTKNISK